MKVLVIDDEPELAWIIQEWLSVIGYTVDHVNSVPAITAR
jgi:CheY-like chemotaxis protein